MRFTRDSALWWIVFVGGLATFLGGHFEMLTKAFPALGAVWQARIELLAAIATFIAAYLRMSPLPLSYKHPLATGNAEETLTIDGRAKFAFVFVALLMAGATTMPGCTPPPSIQTAPGRAAYQADQVVQRLGEISRAVEADTGTLPGNIKPADAFAIIEWISGDAHGHPPTTGLMQIIQTTAGQGWKPAARDGWQNRIRPIFQSYPKLAPYVDVVDALLEVL